MQESGPNRVIEFVILTWNSETCVERCLTSVLAIQTFDVKVHVVDNGSTDGTIGLLDAYAAASDGRMDIIKAGVNLGTTVSRNIALRMVDRDSNYVCVLDSDTVVNERAFEIMIAALDTDETIGLIGPTMHSSVGEKQLSGRNLPTADLKIRKAFPIGAVAEKAAHCEVPTAPVVNGLQDVGYLLSACWLMPRRTLSEVGLLDEEIFYAPEDVDYCVRVQNAGYRVVYCRDAEIVHEYQRLSKKKLLSRMNIAHIKGLGYYFKKHGYLLNSAKAIRKRLDR